mmetsp:Transcript_34878/g.58615  ORF Transcript_34878/g.58615 Transcript_34878/m.58615 type:complete len:244 (-) Transcript_34878:154-885(-)
MLAVLRHSRNAALLQEDVHRHSSPKGGRDSARPPVESHRLLAHVLLLPPVACAHQRHGDALARHVHDIVHSERLLHGAIHIDCDTMLLPLDGGDGTVVAHVMDGGRGEETRFDQKSGRRLTVERVTACQADQFGMARNPGIGGADVLRIHRVVDCKLPIHVRRRVPMLHAPFSSFLLLLAAILQLQSKRVVQIFVVLENVVAIIDPFLFLAKQYAHRTFDHTDRTGHRLHNDSHPACILRSLL